MCPKYEKKSVMLIKRFQTTDSNLHQGLTGTLGKNRAQIRVIFFDAKTKTRFRRGRGGLLHSRTPPTAFCERELEGVRCEGTEPVRTLLPMCFPLFRNTDSFSGGNLSQKKFVLPTRGRGYFVSPPKNAPSWSSMSGWKLVFAHCNHL